ncbi:helix-turn-helix domain-containing protein [Litoribacterium kuwaitense]|uniref:helix-turn-helix domain-containing protein n=1 Tax=Litoribacterium kuwaitense TaxID=1398745 RepID=UPI001FEB4487|nr:AraC family transcriptional regulator [Litoribacterium kuwaitense]
MQPRLDELFQVEIPIKLEIENFKFVNTFLEVISYWKLGDPISKLKTQTKLTEMIIMILQTYVKVDNLQVTSPQSLHWITSYFSFHLGEPLSVSDMAQRAHLSISRFNEIFKMQYGTTPYQYLLNMRVSHACELLINTNLTQEKIASYCGFSDIHHFSKVFKKKVGVAPGEYQQKEC